MEKVIYCSDLGYKCDAVVRAHSEKEALEMAAQHAKSVHGLEKITPEVMAKIKSAIREEETS